MMNVTGSNTHTEVVNGLTSTPLINYLSGVRRRQPRELYHDGLKGNKVNIKIQSDPATYREQQSRDRSTPRSARMETDHETILATYSPKQSWPSPQDYNEAVQNLSTCFSDPDLKSGAPELDALGLPRPASGAFASVYKVQSGTRTFAVRCFLNNVRDSENRYQQISDYVMNDQLPYTVSFQYQAKGVLIRGDWYPILKMDWVEGQTLDSYIETNLHKPDRLVSLLAQFQLMCTDLESAGIAHGDLQHGNIMVTSTGELRLVDYDGMFVPSMQNWKSNELGHRNYQHPKRDATHFGSYLDTFAKWSIFVSLCALVEKPSLYKDCKAGGDCLLLRKDDYLRPEQSRSLKLLLRDGSPSLVQAVKCLLWLSVAPPDCHLALNQQVNDAELPSITYSITKTCEEEVAQWWDDFLNRQSKSTIVLCDRDILSLPVRQVVTKYEGLPVYLQSTTPKVDYVGSSLALLGFACVGTLIHPAMGAAMLILGAIAMRSLLKPTQPTFSQNSPELIATGIATEGLVTEKRTVGDPGAPDRQFLIHYEYNIALPDGRTSRRAADYAVPALEWNSIPPGTELTILYFEHDSWVSVPYECCHYKALAPHDETQEQKNPSKRSF
ncbi:MAG: hypothetical protein K2W95_16125 [Candidatus Obscuribacterales bacterium]|nr:hypothetical protein [Candidatus Obscuribacterales bacterium]